MDKHEASDSLPKAVQSMLQSAFLCEFATVSSAMAPIDTPVGCFWNPDGTIGVTTSLSYPVKAERARRNPKVGLLIEGFPGEPLVMIAGLASVRDADIQANIDRYLPEISNYWESFAAGYPWAIVREGVHYWSRIIIDITPVRIWWWDDGLAAATRPHRWDAPADVAAPPSDPAPQAPSSAAPDWSPKSWSEQADEVVAADLPAHLTLLDPDGFPLPFRVRSLSRNATGFSLAFPDSVPWDVRGQASLCFMGRATFIGAVTPTPGGAELRVDRALPVMPTVSDLDALWSPTSETRRKLTERLKAELARRGQPMPSLPHELPAPSSGALLRARRSLRLREETTGPDAGGKESPYVR